MDIKRFDTYEELCSIQLQFLPRKFNRDLDRVYLRVATFRDKPFSSLIADTNET